MKIAEIFKSIDGEGIRTGEPTIFIRFAGCNLHCEYCDTAYAMKANQSNPEYSNIEAVIQKILSYSIESANGEVPINNITITGGEPLMYVDDIINILECLNQTHCAFCINIETNGSISPKQFLKRYKYTQFHACIFNSLFFTFDIKTASAGEYEKDMCIGLNTNKPKALEGLDALPGVHHVMKAVVGSIDDLEYVKSVYDSLTIEEKHKFMWFISPVFGKIEPSEIVDFILKYPELNDWRAQVQLHKIIWDPNKRGV